MQIAAGQAKLRRAILNRDIGGRENDVDSVRLEGESSGQDRVGHDVRDVRLAQQRTMRIRIGGTAAKGQITARGLASAVGIAGIDLEIWRRSEFRHELSQDELLISVYRPVAVPDEVHDLGAGQD